MKQFRFFALIALFVALTAPAFALDLQGARASGLVGEKLNGYVAAIKDTPDTAALVADVNKRRQAEYGRISAENGQPVDVVAKLAAQQIIQNLPAGSLYQGADGGWKKR